MVLPDRDRGEIRSDRSRAGPVHDGKDPAPKSLRDQSSPRYYTAVLWVEISKCEYLIREARKNFSRKGEKKKRKNLISREIKKSDHFHHHQSASTALLIGYR